MPTQPNTTAPDTLPADFDFGQQGAVPNTPAPNTTAPDTLPADFDFNQAQPPTPGEITNDVGNTVIVPKEGENFSDTMRRAAAQGKKTTPEQINREVGTMPGKAATVLAAAPAIGAVQTAGEALPGVLMHTAEGVKAVTAWAAANPVKAYILYNVIKDVLPGAKKAIGLAKALPTGE